MLVKPSVWEIGKWGTDSSGAAFLRWTGTSAPTITTTAQTVSVSTPPTTSLGIDTLELFFGRLVGGRPAPASLTIMSRPLVGDPRLRMMVWCAPVLAFP